MPSSSSIVGITMLIAGSVSLSGPTNTFSDGVVSRWTVDEPRLDFSRLDAIYYLPLNAQALPAAMLNID
jgi:hypothetical protein